MAADSEAQYLFQRAREEAAKALAAKMRKGPAGEISAHRELALRYKVRALAMSCPDQIIVEAMENYQR